MLTNLGGVEACQIKHCCDDNASLVARRQTVHDVLQSNLSFLRWWRFAHERRRVRRETVAIHLREVYSRVLARAVKDYHGQIVSQILTSREGCWEAFVHPFSTRRVAAVPKIFGPVFYLRVLQVKFTLNFPIQQLCTLAIIISTAMFCEIQTIIIIIIIIITVYTTQFPQWLFACWNASY